MTNTVYRALLLLLLLFPLQDVQAQLYRRDSSFNGNGLAMPTGHPHPLKAHNLKKILLQPDGKILLVGALVGDAPIEIVRLNQNGTIDQTFGTNGYYQKDMAPSQAFEYQDAALMPTGQILVLGTHFYAANADGLLLRVNANGTTDNTYGSGGIVNLSSLQVRTGSCVIVQPDGKALVGGYKHTGGMIYLYVIARLNTNGTPDNTFGQNGWIENVFPQFAQGSGSADKLALQPDGKIIMATTATDPSAPFHGTPINVVRFKSNGVLDSTFAQNGLRTCQIDSAGSFLGDLMIDSATGDIYPSGLTSYQQQLHPYPNEYQPFIFKLNSSGALVPSFGTNGRVIMTNPLIAQQQRNSVYLATVMRQPNGKFIITGHTDTSATSAIRVYRLNANGSLDASFCNGGVLDLQRGKRDQAVGGAVLPNGDLLIGGFTYDKPSAHPQAFDTAWMICMRLTDKVKQGISNAHAAAGNISVYPNPADRGHFYLKYDGLTSLNGLKLDLYDAAGRMVEARSYKTAHTTGEIEFTPLHSLPGGMYLLHVTNEQGSYLPIKLMITK